MQALQTLGGTLRCALWIIGLLWAGGVMAVDGLISIPSQFGERETMDRFEAEIKARGMNVFARIDHGAGAVAAGMPLRPTEVLLFGSPKAGTPLMQAAQSIGIDLPLKVLVYEDAAGGVWLAYNDPSWLAKRHGLHGGDSEATVNGMTAALKVLANKATHRGE